MFPGAKIIAVDDDEDDLRKILVALKNLGLACASFQYPDEQPQAGISFGGIRLYITDINLIGGDSPGDEARKLTTAISLIERIIARGNGPYALITWSTTTLHDALVARIKATGSLSERQPFFSMALNKSDFLEDPDKLKVAIQSIFTANAPFGAILDWERRVSKASERVLSDLYSFSQQIPAGDPSENMDRLLSKLSVDAFGKGHAADHVFESVNEALMPILSDALNTEFFSSAPDGIWEKAITKFADANDLADDIVCRLNSSVVLELSPDIKPYRRGAILELPDDWLTDEAFTRTFGDKQKVIRGTLLKLERPKDLKWVLIQAQAACDFAQGRIGPMPFLLAAVVPASFARKKGGDGIDLPLPASVWQSPELSKCSGISDNDDFHFEILNGICCQLTRSRISEVNFKVLGRLKDQIVTSIGYEYHSHGSRPGFVSFQKKRVEAVRPALEGSTETPRSNA